MERGKEGGCVRFGSTARTAATSLIVWFIATCVCQGMVRKAALCLSHHELFAGEYVMEMLTLYASTGNPQVDNVLRGAIGILEDLFPERVRSCYLHGSFVDNTGIET